MRPIAESFAWPFRGRWVARWSVGAFTVLLLPLLFIPLLGYAVAATRAAEAGAAEPPPWTFSKRLVGDGAWMSLAVAVVVLPFALVLEPFAGALADAHVWAASDATIFAAHTHVIAFLVLALPWGLAALLLLPHAAAAFAATGSPRDAFDYAASLRGVRRDFAAWNVVAAAIVTAWGLGLACAGLLCVGVVPGIFYAILVSAHATATLRRKDQAPPAG